MTRGRGKEPFRQRVAAPTPHAVRRRAVPRPPALFLASAGPEPVAKEELALVLTILRTVRGWNEDGLARASEVANSAISDYERGRRLPELATLERLLRRASETASQQPGKTTREKRLVTRP
jgi:hypothetical protein